MATSDERSGFGESGEPLGEAPTLNFHPRNTARQKSADRQNFGFSKLGPASSRIRICAAQNQSDWPLENPAKMTRKAV